MSIGLSQVKSAFGFATLPSNCVGYTEGNSPAQQGQKAYPYNSDVMAWYTQNWYTQFKVSPTANAKQTATANAILQGTPSAINPLAVKICFAIFVPITIMNYFKSNVFKATSERKKRWSYWIFNIVTSLLPFFCLIIATNQTLSIKKNTDFYSNSLSIVGVVAPGLNILRSPTMQHPFGPFFVDCIPIALIAFMESYAVARRIASTNHQVTPLDLCHYIMYLLTYSTDHINVYQLPAISYDHRMSHHSLNTSCNTPSQHTQTTQHNLTT